jgi:hypothetical protein
MILSKSELCGIIGISATAFTSDAIAGQISLGAQKFLKPILGTALLAHLSGSINFELDLSLQDLCKKALAHLVYATYLPSLAISLTGSGIGVTNTDNTKAASEARLAALESQHKEIGYNYLELLLEELRVNSSSLSEYVRPTGLENCFINSLAYFETYFSLGGSALTFFSLRHLIARVERSIIVPLLGSVLHDELIDRLNGSGDGSESDTHKSYVIELLCEASVYLSVSQALIELPVRLSSEGLFIYPFTEVLGTKMRSAADISQIKALQIDCDRKGMALLEKATGFIKSHLSDFDGFVSNSVSSTSNQPISKPAFTIL